MTKTALDYAEKHVSFWQESPISGKFDARKYPFIRKPLQSLDDIVIRESVIYGPAQSFKSVYLQIATAYRLGIYQSSVLAFAQSDPDADEFAKVKLNPFLERMPHLVDLCVSKHTIRLWRWANHELIISGPGENAQQSKSARFVHTDESHLYPPGTLAALADRTGQRWNRHILHVTTAADSGTEVDVKYHAGDQNEWHVRCLHCNALFEPLWQDESKRRYNGHRVFQWTESESETEQLNSIHFVCPHCDKPIETTPRNRLLMDDGADYVPANLNADRTNKSFRWNAFASRFKPLRDLFSIYLSAMQSAKLGDFKPYENWVKKQEARTWTGELPLVGVSTAGRDHAVSEITVEESDLPVVSFDIQDKGGFHIWALADLWHPNGDSKRLAYEKLASFDDLRAFQLRHGVREFDPRKHRAPSVCGDHGHREPEVFAACARWNWLAMKSTDEEEFLHELITKGMPTRMIPKPWSKVRPGNPLLGKAHAQKAKLCATIMWSKPRIYSMLYRLKNNETGRKYGIASDFPIEFERQLHSYAPGQSTSKTGTAKTFWRKLVTDDHAFVCAAQSLLLATIHGVYSVPDEMLGTAPKTLEIDTDAEAVANVA